jgi:3',5'-cyclic AMP phosphodiesterase CpdA
VRYSPLGLTGCEQNRHERSIGGRKEFGEARAFLDRIASPKLVVPGNHDVPLYNLFTRFITPLARYSRAITSARA